MNYNYFVDISSSFFLIFLIGTICCSIIENFLDWKNSNKGNVNLRLKDVYKIHPLIKKYFSFNKVKKIQEYNTESSKFSDFSDSIHSSLSMIMFLCGISPFFIHTIINTFPNLPTTVHYLIFFFGISLVKCLFEIPFSLYDTFKIEEKYGFNKMSKKLFLCDTIKSFILGTTLSLVSISIINYFLTKFGPFSSTNVCIFVAGLILFGFVMEFLYMTVFIRIFNKLTPLKDKKLSSRISNLLKKYGYKTSSVYVIDASKRSTKSNAFIGGIWKSKKIVLFDTLLKKYTHDELISILGHELAHGKLHHLILNRIISSVTTLITVYITFLLAYNINLYHAFGFNFVTEANMIQYSLIGFILASIVIGSVKWILSPLESWISRKCEYAADKYSVKYTNKREAMISALLKLTSENMGDLFPDKLYEAYNYSHPSLINRITALKRNDKSKKRTKK